MSVPSNPDHPEPPPPTAPPRAPRLPWRWVAAAGAVLLAAVCGIWLLRDDPLTRLPEFDLAAASPPVRRSIERAREAVRKSPRSGAAWGRLGILLRAHEFGPAANVCLAEAERLDPGQVLWPYILGVSLSITDPAAAAICF